jgi:hypothetical protein
MPTRPCIRPSKQDGTDTISIKSPEAGDAINALKDSKGCHHERAIQDKADPDSGTGFFEKEIENNRGILFSFV